MSKDQNGETEITSKKEVEKGGTRKKKGKKFPYIITTRIRPEI
jgi:hypothetical protein